MMRWVRGAFAGFALIIGVVGAPLALIAWGNYPAALTALRADDASLLLAVLTVLGWGAWGAFTTATAAELITLITGRTHRLPGLGPVQSLAGGLLLLVITALPIAAVVAPGTPAALAIPQPDPAPAPGSGPATATAQPIAVATDVPTYTVVPGDDLWSIAERLLGDGRNWRLLSQLNPQLGSALEELQPGSKLVIPSTAQALKATAKTETVTVQKGDTLSELAEDHLGNPAKWPKIAAANAIIDDPDHIEIGWKLRIPGSKATPPSTDTVPANDQQAPSPGSLPARPDADPLPAESVPVDQVPSGEATTPITTASVAESASATPPLTIGTLAAAAVIGGLELRRVLRQRERPLGQHQPPASEPADQLRTALKATEQPDSLAALVAALAAVGQHCRKHGIDLPGLATVRVGGEEIALDWAAPTVSPPFGFTGDKMHWVAPINPPLPSSELPCPYPALVSLGTAEDGEVLLIDAERSRVLAVAGSLDQRQDALSAIGVELACAPWSAGIQLFVVGAAAGLVAKAGDDRVQVVDQDQALVKLRQITARRQQALGGTNLGALRVDPDRTDAVAAFVFCFLDELPPELIAEVEQLQAGDPLGVAVILGTHTDAAAQWQVGGQPNRPEGRLAGRPGSLAAHTISSDMRAELAELFAATDTVPAPWWAEDNVYQLPTRDEEEVDVIRLVTPDAHPRLLLIGPAELHGATGPEPARSRQQLTELCAWLLSHPGSTATQMASGMTVAESTRRSNLSRLRNWLGNDESGEPYLPDAYSGRISLHSGVTSDWQQLLVLLAPGISRVSDSTLVAALELVRGAPLADAAPGQWYWAEELRTEIAAALRDVGLVLTERALRNHDLDLARWAAGRALVVAPEDELLLCARLRTEYEAGNRSDTERLVNQLTRQASILGVDLMEETVELCQQVIEGRLRARA